MQAQFIELCVFSTPEDDQTKVREKLIGLFPFDLDKEKVKLSSVKAEGFSDRCIVIMRVTLTRQRHITQFLKSLVGKMNLEQMELLLRQKETRVDDNLYFYMRFDKPRLIDEDNLWITDEGNCYHVKIALAPFPRKRELAYKILEEILANSS
jgi:RNA binding exosome subunit